MGHALSLSEYQLNIVTAKKTSVCELCLNSLDTHMYASRFNEWLGFSFELLLLSKMYWLRAVSGTGRITRH